MSPSRTEILEHARQYAAIGWHVIPVIGKMPIGKEWPARATNEADKLQSLFACNHDGLGVLLGERSGIIDIEADNDEAAEQVLQLFDGEEIVTPTFQSSRGRHQLFKWTPKLPAVLLAKAKWMAGAIEIRAGGGGKAAQTVFPPSAGRQWIVDPQTPVAELPARVLEKLRAMAERSEKKTIVIASELLPMNSSGAPSADRLDVAGWLTRRGVPILTADEHKGVSRWFIRCPGLDRHTGKDAVKDCVITQGQAGELGGHCFHASCGMTDWQALKQAIGAPEFCDYPQPDRSGVDVSGLIVSIHSGDEQEELIEESSIYGRDLETPFPAECLSPQGIMGAMMAHTLETAIYPQPELALAGSIALMATITGRKVCDSWDSRTNCYVLGLAKSGAGKDQARKVNNDILCHANGAELIGSERIGSHSGIVSALANNPSQLLQLDEMGRILETMKDARRAPHLYNVITILMQLYSSSAKMWKSDSYADQAKVKTIDQPHLVVYGTSTPEAFWNSLTTGNVSEGLAGRLLVFEGRGYEIEMQTPKKAAPPDELVERVRSWIDFSPAGVLQNAFASAVEVEHDEDAFERYREHIRAISVKRRGESDLRAAIWSRSGEKTGKLALIHACSRAEGPPERITLTDVEWAVKLSNYLTRRLLAGCRDFVSENEHESRLKRLLGMIPTSGISLTGLCRKTQWLKARDRSEMLADLERQGLVTHEMQAGKTKSVLLLKRIG